MHALKKHRLANHIVHVVDGQEALDFFFGEGRDVPVQSTARAARFEAAEGGGIEVLRRLRADERTKLVPVVVLTSSREDQDVMETYQLGPTVTS